MRAMLETTQTIFISVFIIEIILVGWLILKGRNLNPTARWLSFIALAFIPLGFMVLGNYFIFENSKSVSSCAGCHVMQPIVNDMLAEESETLAAVHYKNNWIEEDQCYTCHTDYGLSGTFNAKLDGFGHLVRYITNAYSEPIKYRGVFPSNNCGSCHYEQDNFLEVEVHQNLMATFKTNAMSCMNCHGKAHPKDLKSASAKLPPHQSVAGLGKAENIQEIKEYILTLEK